MLKNAEEPGEEGMVTYQVGPFLTDINFCCSFSVVNGRENCCLAPLVNTSLSFVRNVIVEVVYSEDVESDSKQDISTRAGRSRKVGYATGTGPGYF